MLTAGIDVGSTACKAVVLGDGQVLGTVIGPSTASPAATAEASYGEALARAGVARTDVRRVVGTGYGRARVAFADRDVSELSCHARGAHWLLPSVRTVIDIGGQDTKAVAVDELGSLLEFVMNEKCAAGTGRFLEAMARSLGVDLAGLAEAAEGPGEPCVISSMCSVFAESEVINLVNEGVALPRIVKGIQASMAGRVATLALRVGLEPEVMVTGGVANSRGVMDALGRRLGVTLRPPPDGFDPQLVGALGAAVLATEEEES